MVLALLLSCACSGTDEEAPDFTGCPSAPLPELAGKTCGFHGQCLYDSPRGIGTERVDSCNQLELRCASGEVAATATAVACPPFELADAPVCPSDATNGAKCTLRPMAGSPAKIGNGECVLEGSAPTTVCACDEPGPKWRCVRRGPP